MPTKEEQEAFDAAMDDPLLGIASPIPTLWCFGVIALATLILWLTR